MEFHAAAQIEFPGRRVDCAPAFGETGYQPGLRIDIGQRFKNMPCYRQIGLGGEVLRIQRSDFTGEADAQFGSAGPGPGGKQTQLQRKAVAGVL